jgi:predicted RNA binding protein YcfA (HicA-like mRNA interferase family)
LRLPRDVSGDDLAKALADLSYRVTRQTGSHLRLTTLAHGEHHVTVPRHGSLRVGTFAGVLSDVAQHFGLTREALVERLFAR